MPERLTIVATAKADLIRINNRAARYRKHLEDARRAGDLDSQAIWAKYIREDLHFMDLAADVLAAVEGQEVQHAC